MASPRLSVIGLDAATFTVIDPLLADGELPSLARLFAAGSRGVLRSTTHPLTPTAWTTMVTGVNPGRHGLWDFTERDETGYRLRVVSGAHRRAPAVWDYLNAAGRPTGLVNVPFTSPAPELNGFVLGGFDASFAEEGTAYPRDLVADLERQFGRLVLDHSFPLDDRGRVDLDLVRRAAEQKVEVALHLSERFEPELLFVVFMAADHIHHLCWPDWETRGPESAVAEVYRILDSAVGALMAHAGDADVMVVSDHGGGALEGVINLNAWLAGEGYLSYATGADMLRGGELGRRLVHDVFELRRRLPKGLRRAVRRRLPAVRERAYELRRFSVIDWRRTRAFAYGTFGNIVLNVRGREENGIVEPGAYERVRDEIAARALELRDRDDDPIVAAVHRREDLFDGPELERIPDLLIEFDQYRWLGKGNMKRQTATIWDEIEIRPGSNESYVGSHRHEGILALAGPSAARGRSFFAGVEDVAPSVLYLLGEAMPRGLDGRVVEEALAPSLLDERPPEYREAEGVEMVVGRTRAAAAGDVEERLRGLGYLE